ncbi:MAG: cellulose biosynthesis cyclic di-GMP-binding regulatory protein BcsB, partial [Methylococcaceae bacterium]|nr:cellulose biosynthesis cyclic di-GMP-binding regulatory protein BcsB [Methylococcaceae bacterium]
MADVEPAVALHDRIETNNIKRPLSWFIGNSSPLSFDNEVSTATITIPEPADIKIKSVKLYLTGIASTALEAKASSILVSVNDNPATTIPLDGARPDINEKISLPSNLFTTGYNQISFRAILTTGRVCEKFNAPPLWARISAASRVSIDTTPRALVPRFDRLRSIFDKHTLLHAETVTILYNEKAADHPSTIISTAEG